MSQHDMTIANADGATVRADINAALEALSTVQSGATAPSPTFAFQLWADTANNLLKQRNAANTAWINRCALNQVGSVDSQLLDGRTAQNVASIITPYVANDSGTDAYQFALGGDLSTVDIFVADIDSANTTASPTGENTSGTPSGAQSIVTTAGAAFAGMLEARPHRFQWDGTNYVVLDPAGGVVEKGSNSNGDYVQYGDGTLVCYHDVSITYNSGGNMTGAWTFPKAFSAEPAVAANLDSASMTPAFPEVTHFRHASHSASVVTLVIDRIVGLTSFTPGDTAVANALAIGKA